EAEAYRRIQQYSMIKRKTIKEIAESIIHSASRRKE
ncbi:MAG: ANTAR domain-containing protein, partial [Selenomonadaceae bacterium]